MTHSIYGLIDPDDKDETVRYVGYTSKALDRRLIEHLAEARKLLSHRHKWLMSLGRAGRRPVAIVLEVVTADTWQAREQFWIAKFAGNNLVNATDGGEGLVNPSADVRQRISAKVSTGLAGNSRRTGIPHDDAVRAKISASLSCSTKKRLADDARRGKPGHPMSAEARAKISASKTGKPHPRTPEWTAKISEARRGKKQSRATIERRAESLRGNANARGAKRSDEARAAISAKRSGGRWITDGVARSFLRANAELPTGWRYGVPLKQQPD